MKNTSILKAMQVLYDYIGNTEPDILNDIEHGYLTENTGRSGRDVVWYADENNDVAVYVDTLEILSDEEIDRELL